MKRKCTHFSKEEVRVAKKESSSLKSENDDTVIDLKSQISNLKYKVKTMEEEQEKTETRLKNVSIKSNERLLKLEAELDASKVALLGMINAEYSSIVMRLIWQKLVIFSYLMSPKKKIKKTGESKGAGSCKEHCCYFCCLRCEEQ